MSTIQIEKTNALKAYQAADPSGKAMLEALLGKENFSKGNIMDRIKTYEDACHELGIEDPTEQLPYSSPVTRREEAANAFVKLDIISEALNEGTILNWADKNQAKYYPYFNNYQPGSGFSFDGAGYDWAYAVADGGARLCVKTDELAKYFGTQFLELWNQFLNPNK